MGAEGMPETCSSVEPLHENETTLFLCDGDDVPNEKQLAREKYEKQHSKCRGGHTLRARYETKSDKTNEVSEIQGKISADLYHGLCYGQVSAPKAAEVLGGTCTVLPDSSKYDRFGGDRSGVPIGQSYD